MSIGGGAVVAEREYDTSSLATSTLRGGGGAIDLLIGGTPSPGFAVGGGILLNAAEDPSNETAAGTVDTGLQTGASVLGVFIDGFPDPEGGFHVGGMLGLAGYNVEDDPLTGDEQTGGFGAAVWAGFGGWVGSEWTLGGMLRFTGAATRADLELPDGSDVAEDVRVGTFSILFTALYH
jgi:hypothetical protein